MNLYLHIGDQIGTLEARALAQRLVAWHDSMVKHLRVVGPRRTAKCGEECAHDEARTLWKEAQDLFGRRARELPFLRTHGRGADHTLSRAAESLRLDVAVSS